MYPAAFTRNRKTVTSGMPALAVSLSLLVGFGQICGFSTQAQNRKTTKQSALTGDQRIAHVLSRLTFGARPGDFQRVKAMGIGAFIAQQLDPDSLNDSALMAKLRRLPTLGMATPVIIEQYTPPKPVASPSPAPAQPVEKSKPPSQIANEQMPAEKNSADRMSALPANENMKTPE